MTAGPTIERLDPIRYLSNFSSGKMGYSIAGAARKRGAEVVLVSGPSALRPPPGVELVPVSSAEEMHKAVLKHLPEVGVVVKAAAVADFRPVSRQAQKIKKGDQAAWTLELERTPDILGELGRIKGDRILVGFAAETENLVENAGRKLTGKNLDLVVANDVTQPGAGFDTDTNVVTFVFPEREPEVLPCLSKEAVAQRLLDEVAGLLENRKSQTPE